MQVSTEEVGPAKSERSLEVAPTRWVAEKVSAEDWEALPARQQLMVITRVRRIAFAGTGWLKFAGLPLDVLSPLSALALGFYLLYNLRPKENGHEYLGQNRQFASAH